MQSVANDMLGSAHRFQQNLIAAPVAQVRFLYLRLFGSTKAIAQVDHAVGPEKSQV
jgi:hypothetical protein